MKKLIVFLSVICLYNSCENFKKENKEDVDSIFYMKEYVTEEDSSQYFQYGYYCDGNIESLTTWYQNKPHFDQSYYYKVRDTFKIKKNLDTVLTTRPRVKAYHFIDFSGDTVYSENYSKDFETHEINGNMITDIMKGGRRTTNQGDEIWLEITLAISDYNYENGQILLRDNENVVEQRIPFNSQERVSFILKRHHKPVIEIEVECNYELLDFAPNFTNTFKKYIKLETIPLDSTPINGIVFFKYPHQPNTRPAPPNTFQRDAN